MAENGGWNCSNSSCILQKLGTFLTCQRKNKTFKEGSKRVQSRDQVRNEPIATDFWKRLKPLLFGTRRAWS